MRYEIAATSMLRHIAAISLRRLWLLPEDGDGRPFVFDLPEVVGRR